MDGNIQRTGQENERRKDEQSIYFKPYSFRKDKMKITKNIDRLTDFALDSFGIANPIKEKEKECPICKKKYPVNEFEGDICMTCYKLEQEQEDDGHDYEYEKWRDYREQNIPIN